MKTLNIPKTFTPKAHEIERSWWLVDAEGQTLGRMASDIARILQGKHKATYVPHMDSGDYVVIINAGKFTMTGDKKETKVVYRHSGYPGGLKTTPYMKDPIEGLRRTIKGMLPRTKLGNQMLKKLKLYEGSEHFHGAQDPKPLQLPSQKQK